ncbi:hypothetical protein D3C71_2181590 [compost metagenome]
MIDQSTGKPVALALVDANTGKPINREEHQLQLAENADELTQWRLRTGQSYRQADAQAHLIAE